MRSLTKYAFLLKLMDKSKKRPLDILASLDAAFATQGSKPISKYTSAAVSQVNAAAQQAYQHRSKKKKPFLPTNHKRNGSPLCNNDEAQKQRIQVKEVDPLYRRLDLEILRVGLKNCTLV